MNTGGWSFEQASGFWTAIEAEVNKLELRAAAVRKETATKKDPAVISVNKDVDLCHRFLLCLKEILNGQRDPLKLEPALNGNVIVPGYRCMEVKPWHAYFHLNEADRVCEATVAFHEDNPPKNLGILLR